jgi:ubiquinone/menaquinone biosynthesis C-methylase UbiE
MANVYSSCAYKYGAVKNEKFDDFLAEEINFFSSATLAVGTKVVDLGSGPGDESMILKSKGITPLCIDISEGMVNACIDKGLNARKMDFYNLSLPQESFAGAWMAFSLLHVPKKDVKKILENIHKILMPKGILYVSLFEGEGEGLREEDVKKFGSKRYFSYYKTDELQSMLSECFDVYRISKLDISPRPTIAFESRKREK